MIRHSSTIHAGPSRILIVSKYELMREAAVALLSTNTNFTIIGKIALDDDHNGNSDEILGSDMAMIICSPGQDLGPIADILKINPDLNVMVVAEKLDIESQAKAVELGAVGIVHKEQSAKILFEAIRQICMGETWLNQTLLSKVLKGKNGQNGQGANGRVAPKAEALTRRELDVVRMIGEGLKNKEIAEKLEISEATVRHHLSSIYGKTGVDDRLNLVIYAYENRLIEIPSQYEGVVLN